MHLVIPTILQNGNYIEKSEEQPNHNNLDGKSFTTQNNQELTFFSVPKRDHLQISKFRNS